MAVALVVAASLGVAACGDTDDEPAVEQGSGASGDLASVAADVERIAPALEGHFFDSTYAMTLEEAEAAMADAGLEPTAPNVVGSYVYDPEAVEFTLCIEAPGGAFASYNTQPMSVQTSGESGGCPEG